MTVTSSVNTPSYTATTWPHLTHIDKDLHASACQVGSILWGERMAGCKACYSAEDSTSGVSGMVIYVHISCNVQDRELYPNIAHTSKALTYVLSSLWIMDFF